MRYLAVSILGMMTVMPTLAGVRLPVVDVTTGGVSARAMFGEEIMPTVAQSDVTAVKSQKKVVSRSKKQIEKSADNTEKNKIAKVQTTDVLMPQKPSADLWSQAEVVPLRMPSVSEFSVIRSEDVLPEERLEEVFVRSNSMISDDAGIKNVVKRTSSNNDFDLQIARLNELQKRADESVQKTDKYVSTEKKEQNVNLTRMVVPMERDVIVRTVEKSEPVRVATINDDMSNMSPSELRKAFKKTFLSENKHLSTYQIDNRFDVVSDMTSSVEGFTARRDLSEQGGIRPLEIKIKFRNDDSALSRDNYNLLTEYAGIVLANPTRAIQVAIPQAVTVNSDERKLAARRLAIVEQALRDSGISEHRILPVLSQRDENGFVLRMISSDQYETLSQQQKNIFGDTVGKKTYKSMSW